jgi:hypothetical protein
MSMTPITFSAEALEDLPDAIWIPSPVPVFYRGAPPEMIQAMVSGKRRRKPLRQNVKFLLEEAGDPSGPTGQRR